MLIILRGAQTVLRFTKKAAKVINETAMHTD